jgi:hypothetical protein
MGGNKRLLNAGFNCLATNRVSSHPLPTNRVSRVITSTRAERRAQRTTYYAAPRQRQAVRQETRDKRQERPTAHAIIGVAKGSSTDKKKAMAYGYGL